jgi:hypothetical protein
MAGEEVAIVDFDLSLCNLRARGRSLLVYAGHFGAIQGGRGRAHRLSRKTRENAWCVPVGTARVQR